MLWSKKIKKGACSHTVILRERVPVTRWCYEWQSTSVCPGSGSRECRTVLQSCGMEWGRRIQWEIQEVQCGNGQWETSTTEEDRHKVAKWVGIPATSCSAVGNMLNRRPFLKISELPCSQFFVVLYGCEQTGEGAAVPIRLTRQGETRSRLYQPFKKSQVVWALDLPSGFNQIWLCSCCHSCSDIWGMTLTGGSTGGLC